MPGAANFYPDSQVHDDGGWFLGGYMTPTCAALAGHKSLVRAGNRWSIFGVMPTSLLVVQVNVHVKPDGVQAFRAATLDNARSSAREPGIVRFDVLEDREDPTRFVLIEVYRDENAPAAHKVTAHYQAWRDAVEPLMAEPRSSRRLKNLFPEDAGW